MAAHGIRYLPPDGGWGWSIVVAAFLNTAICMGILKSFGLFLVEFFTIFDSSTASLAWIHGLSYATIYALAPVTSNLGKLVGYRIQLIIGGVIATLGYVLAQFSTSVTHLYLTMGLLAGIGFSLAWVPTIGLVGMYFDKRRSIANGFASAGAGVGSFLIPPLISYLLGEYGYKGTLLLTGALTLNMSVGGFLYRPLEEIGLRDETGSDDIAIQKTDLESKSSCCRVGLVESQKSHEKCPNNHTPAVRCDIDSTSLKGVELLSASLQDVCSVSMTDVSGVGMTQQGTDVNSNATGMPRLCNYICGIDSDTCMEHVNRFKKDFWQSVWNKDVVMNPAFLIFATAIVLVMYGYPLVHLMLPVRANELGLTINDSALLVSILSGVELVLRVLMGFLYDSQFVKSRVVKYKAFAACLILTGISSLLSNLATDFLTLAAYCICFATLVSSFPVLLLTLMVDLFGRHNVTSTWGMILLVRTLPGLTGSAFVGYLRDVSGDSRASFYFMGCALISAGLIMLITFPLVLTNKQRLDSQPQPVQPAQQTKHHVKL